MGRVLAFALNIVEINGSGDLAHVWNNYSLTTVPAGTTEALTTTGKALVMLRKQPAGEWVMHRVIWNPDEPSPDEG